MAVEKMYSSDVEPVGDTLAGLQAEIEGTGDPIKNEPNNPTDTIPPKEKLITPTKGFNGLETAITNKGDARLRALANVGLEMRFGENKKNSVNLGYSALHEFSGNLETYFGRNALVAGTNFVPKLQAIGIVKTTAEGVQKPEYGVRYLVQDALGMDYGRIDVAGNKEGATATFFLGKAIGKKGTTAELFSNIHVDPKSKKLPVPYSELQINQEVTKGFNVFVRGEVVGIDYKKGTYLLGGSKVF